MAQTVYPAGIPAPDSGGYGLSPYGLTPYGLGVEAFGTVTILGGAAPQTVYPAGIPSEEAFGTATIVLGLHVGGVSVRDDCVNQAQAGHDTVAVAHARDDESAVARELATIAGGR